jgi:hypothetical protein
MKRLLFLMTISFFTIITGCKKDNENGGSNNGNLATQLTASKWKVHYFYYVTDQTKQFGDYVFTFKSDSSLSVSNGTNTYGGGWSVKKDNSGADVIVINVSSLTLVQLLNSDWKVLKNNGSFLELKESSSGTNADLHLMKQ